MTKQEQINTLNATVRQLQLDLAAYRSNYATLSDILSDTAQALRLGHDLDMNALLAFEWKDGR